MSGVRWRYLIPPEKGGWIWWLGPLVIGIAAAPSITPDILVVTLGIFAGFCIRQPVALYVKNRRRRRDVAVSRQCQISIALHASLGVCAGLVLLLRGHAEILLLLPLAAPVILWDIVLVYDRRDRHHLARDLCAAGVLSLAGPAAYLSCNGNDPSTAILLPLLPGLQSTASVLHMFLRLEQRRWGTAGTLTYRLRRGLLPWLHHATNAILAIGLAFGGWAPPAAAIALLLPLLEASWAIVYPQIGHSPKKLGLRQLAISSMSMGALALGWYLWR